MRVYGFSRFVSPFGDDMVDLRVYGRRSRDGDVKAFDVSLSKRFIDERSNTGYFQRVINCRLPCGYRFDSICNHELGHSHGLAALRSLAALRVDL